MKCACLQALADEHAGVHVVDCGKPYVELTGSGTAIAQASCSALGFQCSLCFHSGELTTTCP